MIVLRLTNYKIAISEKDRLKEIADKYKVDDRGLVYDLYALYRKPGCLVSLVSEKKLLLKVEKKYPQENMVKLTAFISSRRDLIIKLIAHPVYTKVIGTIDAVEAVEKLVAIFRHMNRDLSKSICGACRYRDHCSVGQALLSSCSTRGLDTHVDCPQPPANTPNAVASQLTQSANAVLDLVDQISEPDSLLAAAFDSSNTTGMSGLSVNISDIQSQIKQANEFSPTFTGTHLIGVIETLVAAITIDQMQLFKVFETFSEEIGGASGNRKTIDPNGKTVTVGSMVDYSDVIQQLPMELLKSPLQRSLAIANKQLLVKKRTAVRKKSKVLAILLDESASMTSAVTHNPSHILSRGQLAAVLTLSILNYMRQNDGVVLFRFFADSPDKLVKCESKDDYLTLARKIGLGDFNGGGTNILSALTAITQDSGEAAIEYKQPVDTLFLITDCEDSKISIQSLSPILKTTKLSTLNVDMRLPHSVKSAFEDAGALVTVDPSNLDMNAIITMAKNVTGQKGI